jgi:hypothetical protein
MFRGNWRRGRRKQARRAPKPLRHRFAGRAARRLGGGSRLGFETLEPRLALAVVISEFLADNENGIVDFQAEHTDWIELKNTGAEAVDLGGWYLTDNANNLTKWAFPAGTAIGAGQYLIVYASSKDGEFSGELHTSFGLSYNGEDLALVMPDGTTIADSFLAFPEQFNDVSYGVGASTSSTSVQTLVGASTTVRVIAPEEENAAVDDHWREIGFNDSGWHSGTRSVGFDRNGAAPNLLPLIGRVLTTGEMSNTTTTAYIRFAFDLADKDQLTSLSLDLRFDDGFIAYLNGREVRRVNFAEDFARPQPQWDSFAGNQLLSSTAAATNRVAEAAVPVTFDLTPFLPMLVNGTNVLAFHGVNSNSTTGSSTNRLDFLIEPVLTATRATATLAGSYMAVPTPGDNNGLGTLGFVADTQFSHARGFYDEAFDLEITAETTGATIRYTTDGSLPSLTNGTTYTSPIAIDPTAIPSGHRGVVMIRAAAFQEGYTPSSVHTQSYIFLDKVILQDGSGLPDSATWGHDKEDDEPGENPELSGYQLDPDDKDWAIDPEIRAAVGDGQLISDLKSIPSVSIVMNWDDLFSGTPQPGSPPQTGTMPASNSAVAPNPQGIYIMGRSDERYSSLEYINPNSPSDQFQIDVGIEIQGHSSPTRWNTDKMSLQVKFKFPYGPTELNYPLFDGTPNGENATSTFDTLILDAGFNYTWTHANTSVQSNFARYVSDQVAADLQNLASGVGAAHGKFVHLYLNGVYWGLYNVHERPDDSFADQYYGGNKDDYYAVKHSTNENIAQGGHKYTWVEGGIAAENSYHALLEASRSVEEDPANAALYDAVVAMLDVDQFIDYMVVLMYAGNENDWPHNNWYATFNHVEPNGKWRFHAWDQEHAFPTDDNSDSFDQFEDLTDYNASDDIESPGELFHNLIVNEEFRLAFADRVQALLYNDGALTEVAAQAAYVARLNEIDRAIVGESARWGDNRFPDDPYNRQDWLDVNVNNTTGDMKAVVPDFFPVRTNSVLGHFDAAGWIPTLDAPFFNQYGGQVAAGFDLEITKPGGSPGGATIYYTLDGSDPRLAGGAVSSSAIAYGGAIDLTESTQVKARIFFNNSGTANDWSPLVDKTFFVEEQAVYPLRIVELMYNPPGPDDTEYIELLNTGDQTINLAGVQLAEFSTGGYTFTDGTLAAGERIVVVANQAAFAAAYPGVTNVAPGQFSGSLANEGEPVALLGPLEELVQRFTYGDSNVAGWPDTPDGDGPSLIYIGPFDADAADPNDAAGDPYDDSANWAASYAIGGSPGAAEPAPIPGDYDRNGTVEPADHTKWATDFGMVVSPAAGADGNGDGIVDSADYTVWRDRLGQSINPPGAASAVFVTTSRDEEPVVATAVVEPVESSAPVEVIAAAAPVSPARRITLPPAGSEKVRLPVIATARDTVHAAHPTPLPDSTLLVDYARRFGRPAPSDKEMASPLARRDGRDPVSAQPPAEFWEDDAWLARLATAHVLPPLAV